MEKKNDVKTIKPNERKEIKIYNFVSGVIIIFNEKTNTLKFVGKDNLVFAIYDNVHSVEFIKHACLSEYGGLVEHGGYYPDVLKMNRLGKDTYLSVRVNDFFVPLGSLAKECEIYEPEKRCDELWQLAMLVQTPLKELGNGLTLTGFSDEEELRPVVDNLPTLDELDECLKKGTYQRAFYPFTEYISHLYFGEDVKLKYYLERNEYQIVVDYVKLLNNKPAYGLKGKFFSKVDIHAETSYSYEVKAYTIEGETEKVAHEEIWLEKISTKTTEVTKSVYDWLWDRFNEFT